MAEEIERAFKLPREALDDEFFSYSNGKHSSKRPISKLELSVLSDAIKLALQDNDFEKLELEEKSKKIIKLYSSLIEDHKEERKEIDPDSTAIPKDECLQQLTIIENARRALSKLSGEKIIAVAEDLEITLSEMHCFLERGLISRASFKRLMDSQGYPELGNRDYRMLPEFWNDYYKNLAFNKYSAWEEPNEEFIKVLELSFTD
ncbi:hypothetical protein [Pleionea sediminis]|uniref:hypothetical protein n=1 Tax=Pleionea sediminis TaxID=2569479 RepID=UPI0011869744|nr:hypothetical protein [Pleionea sediminis]